MGYSYLANPLILVINTLFEFFIVLVLLRFLLQMLRANFKNVVSQFIVALTNPALRKLRLVIPSIGRYDTASIVFALLLIYTKFLILRFLGVDHVPISTAMAPIASASFAGLAIISVAELVALIFTIFIGSIIIQVILSWINPGQKSSVLVMIDRLSGFVLSPIRRTIPPINGFDLSPLFGILGLMALKMLMAPTIAYLGNF